MSVGVRPSVLVNGPRKVGIVSLAVCFEAEVVGFVPVAVVLGRMAVCFVVRATRHGRVALPLGR